jgi:hypothetical protein
MTTRKLPAGRTKKTLIEKIFYDIVRREMNPAERRVLLSKPKNIAKPK